MKKNIILLLLIFILSFTVISCGPSDNTDDAVVGAWCRTWDNGSYEELDFSDNGTLNYYFDGYYGSTTDSNGTWSTNNGQITATIDGGDPVTSPYSVTSTTLTIDGGVYNTLD